MYKYSFDKNRRHVKYCPCGRSNNDGKFNPYEGYDDKGYCFTCLKTFRPGSDSQEKNVFRQWQQNYSCSEEAKPMSFEESNTVINSLDNYISNNFAAFLVQRFGIETTTQLIKKYMIGTSDYWSGATIFWLIDQKLHVRGGKIMLYDCNTGSRIKSPSTYITWYHSANRYKDPIRYKDYNLVTCLFGEHLLSSDPLKPIALVESQKTAIIASVYLPEYLWLASGSKGGLTVRHLSSLKGRNIILYPDLDAFDEWKKIASGLSHLASISISTLLEENATDEQRERKLDLADYLLGLPVPDRT